MGRKFVGTAPSDAADLTPKTYVDAEVRAAAASPPSPVSVGTTRLQVGVDGQYAAFPSLTKLTDGRVIMVWYQGSDHYPARDGDVLSAISADRGKSWTTPAVAVGGSSDYRDPAIRLIDRKLYLTYFKGSASSAAEGCFLKISADDGATWGSEIRIDSGQQYSAITAPLVDLGGGSLMAVWYGKTLTADARESIWTATSSDGGATWGTPVKRVDGVALGFNALEPWISKYGSTLVLTYRVNNTQDLGRLISTNNGSTWTSHASILTNATGRPSTVFTADGTLILAYRSLSSPLTKASGLIRYSRDNGATWSGPRMLEQGSPSMWCYSDFCEVDPGVFLVPSAIEESTTVSRLSCRTVAVGSARTAFGDVLGRNRQVADCPDLFDDFDRPDASTAGYLVTGQKWSADSSFFIKDGALALTGTGVSGFKYATVDAKSVNLEIEAEMAYTVGSGLGIVLRWVDANNHLYVTIETNGVNFRLYSKASGTATVLQQSAFPLNVGVWHRIRVVDNGGVIRIFADGALVLTHVLAAGTSTVCGLQAATTSSGSLHQFRRFSVRRRGVLV